MRSTQPFKSLTSLTYILAILASIFLIITFNYYALKTLNGVRAFVSGESLFSKGQLEASRNLILFIHSAEDKHYEQFKASLMVPIADSMARLSMDKNDPDAVTLSYLIQGKNHPQDATEIIWIYKNFKSFKPFQKPINVWRTADGKIKELKEFSSRIYPLVKAGELTAKQKQLYILKVNALSDQLVLLGDSFEDMLGDNIRMINHYALWIINSIAMLIIIGNIYYFYRQIHILSILKEKTQVQNNILRQLNSEMDLFTYSVSHDLRSPITSLKGLVQLAQSEKTVEGILPYFNMMYTTLERQDLFIQNIINLTKHKRIDIEPTDVDLEQLLDQILNDIGNMIEKNKVNIYKDLAVKSINTDMFRLKIILNNLLSNAFKYLDLSKPALNLAISTEQIGNQIKLTIQDNGLGIKKEHHEKIFNMFYVVNHQSKGSGLGLYLVKETLDAIGGKIEMTSEQGFGTSFQIYLPLDLKNVNVL